jgi:hypothetical protein
LIQPMMMMVMMIFYGKKRGFVYVERCFDLFLIV